MCLGVISATFLVLGIYGVSSVYGFIVSLRFWKSFRHYIFNDSPPLFTETSITHALGCLNFPTARWCSVCWSVCLLRWSLLSVLYFGQFVLWCEHIPHACAHQHSANVSEGPCAHLRGSMQPCFVVLWWVNSCCPVLPGRLAPSPQSQVVHWSPSFSAFWDLPQCRNLGQSWSSPHCFPAFEELDRLVCLFMNVM